MLRNQVREVAYVHEEDENRDLRHDLELKEVYLPFLPVIRDNSLYAFECVDVYVVLLVEGKDEIDSFSTVRVEKRNVIELELHRHHRALVLEHDFLDVFSWSA